MIEIDRSRILAYQRCPRERFYAYHAGPTGSGLQRRAKALPLLFGGAFHEGIAVLLPTGDIERAVTAADEFLTAGFNQGVDFGRELPADARAAIEYGMAEQRALAEALLRAWWTFEGKHFLEQFEIVECEREGRGNLTSELVLMFRPDALLRERESGDLYVLSWKTCAYFNQRTLDQAKHDMQSISEVWGIQQEAEQKIEGVLYRWIVKGQRREDKFDHLYKQSTPLIYGWTKPGPTPEESDWSWAYEFPKEDGTGDTKLGKGWRKVPIWSAYPGGIKQWIDDLYNNRIGPRHINALAAVFPQSLPVERRESEVRAWRNQTIVQEMRIAEALMFPPNLDSDFPQYTHSCEAYSGCQFRPICWERVEAAEGELYQIRVPNHKEGESDES